MMTLVARPLLQIGASCVLSDLLTRVYITPEEVGKWCRAHLHIRSSLIDQLAWSKLDGNKKDIVRAFRFSLMLLWAFGRRRTLIASRHICPEQRTFFVFGNAK